VANEDWDQIELQDDPEACTFKATIQRLKVQKEPLDLADPLTFILTVNKIRQDERIEADFVKLRKTLNVAKKEREPRIARITRTYDQQISFTSEHRDKVTKYAGSDSTCWLQFNSPGAW
jgi:hypothetical protein